MEQIKFDKNYFYNGVYKNYDDFLDWAEMAEDLIDRFPSKSFLDIGCGCGNLVKEIKRKADKKNISDCDVMGIDISNYAVNKARAGNIKQANCQSLPFSDKRFETVYILTTFSYLPDEADIQQAMTEAYRVAEKVIVFDDVYTVPEINTDDYDPFRQQVFSQAEWVSKWREILTSSDTINIAGDEIIIRKSN